MITSRLRASSQTTIPPAVRKALGLQAGGNLAYVIGNGRVILIRKDAPPAQDDPFATFMEWTGSEDARAYAGL